MRVYSPLMLSLAFLMSLGFAGHGYAKEADETVNPLFTKQRTGETALLSFQSSGGDRPVKGNGLLLLPTKLSSAQTKFPVMIIVPTVKGISEEHEFEYAKEFNAMGVAAFILDSYTPRGLIATASSPKDVSLTDSINDAYSALMTLSTDPRVDAEKVGIVGFSKGGAVAQLAAMQERVPSNMRSANLGFKMHASFYQGCSVFPYNQKTTGAPIYMFIDSDYKSGTVNNCEKWSNEMKKAGADIHATVYPHSTRGWDYTGSRNYKTDTHKNCTFREQEKGGWIEETSGIKGMANLSGDLYRAALQKCRVVGFTEQYNASVKAQALDALKAAIRKHLLE
jgi:dienelactone hydrolase